MTNWQILILLLTPCILTFLGHLSSLKLDAIPRQIRNVISLSVCAMSETRHRRFVLQTFMGDNEHLR